MSNKHYNGSEPITMSAEEYDRQAEMWKENGGNIRDDHPHTGADYEHSHWYDGNNQNEDFVCVREADDDDDDDDDNEEEGDDDDDDAFILPFCEKAPSKRELFFINFHFTCHAIPKMVLIQ